MNRVIVRFLLVFTCLLFLPFEVLAQEEGPEVRGPVLQKVTLDEAVEMAAQNNPSFMNIDEVIYQADAMIQGAWAMLLPNARAQGSITRNQREIMVGFPNFGTLQASDPSGFISGQDFANMEVMEIPIQDKWGYSLGFSLNTTLFNPRSIPAIKLAYDSADQTKVGAQIQKNELLFAVTSSFYLVYSTKQMIDVNQQNLETAREFLRRSEALKRTGQATKIDVLRAEIQVLDIEKELANTEDSLAMTKTALAYLTGIQGDFDIATPEDVSPVKQNLDGLKKQALEKRVELDEAAFAQAVSERAKNETLMKFLPVFDMTFSWNWNSASGFSGENDAWMLIFGAQWNLFEGGARISEYKQRKSKMRQADNNLTQVALNIRQEVDQGYTDAQRKKRSFDIVVKQLELAETNHQLVSRQYEVGMVSSLDLLSASTELANKRQERVLAKLQYDLAVLTLRKAVGAYSALAVVPLD